MLTHQTTELSTMTTIGKSKYFFKSLFVFFIVSLSLFHIFLDSKPKKIEANNLAYKETIKNRNSKQALYLEELKEGNLSVQEYYNLATSLMLNSKEKIKKINIGKRKINENFSFRGRSSFHFWIFVFGLVTALFYFSCKSLFDEFVRGSTFKHQFISISGITVSMFWGIHLIFFTQNDFNKNTYVTVIIFLAVLGAFFTYNLVKYYTYKDNIITNLLDLLYRIKTKHYPKVANKVYSYEKDKNENKEVLNNSKKDIENFDLDLKETINKIA